jgi:4-hydroxybenzoyl-CoA thioesterase
VYFRWFDEATWALFESLNLAIDSLGKRYNVVGLPLLANNCEFIRPCRLSDQLMVNSSIAELDDDVIVVRHQITKEGTTAVLSHERRFWGVRHPEDLTRLKKSAIPTEVVAILRRSIVDTIKPATAR